MIARPGGQTVTKVFCLVVNSEILKGIKNMIGLSEHILKSLSQQCPGYTEHLKDHL